MLRTFHAIGHGGFYTEKFGNVNVVFDCGSKSKTLIEDEIRDTFSSGEVIDALFISHFHDGHINGIEFIMNHCQVRKLFLPYLTEEDKVYSLMFNYRKGLNNFDEFITDPHDYINRFNKGTEIIMVHGEENPEEEIFRVEDDLKGPIRQNILSGSVIKLQSWCFVPYNLKHYRNRIALNNRLTGVGIDISTVSKFKAAWHTNRKNVKSCFNSLMKHPNDTSMVLYSGPENGRFEMKLDNGRVIRYHDNRVVLDELKAGCMYFGDLDLSTNYIDMEYKFSRYLDRVGVMQIPHHGSRHNYHDGLTSINDEMLHMISGQSTHPHVDVVLKLLKSRQGFSIVTKDRDTEVKFEIR